MYIITKFLSIFSLFFIIQSVLGSEFSDLANINEIRREINTNIKTINWKSLQYFGGKSEELDENSSASEDELVFFSYDTDNKVKTASLETKQPKVADKSILDKMSNTIVPPTAKAKIPDMQVDYSQFISSSHYRNVESFFEISVRRIGAKGIEKDTIKEFDIVPYYDTNEIFTDNGMGQIKVPVGGTSNTPMNFKASVAARNLVRTNFEISPRVDGKFSIPVFEQDVFDNMVKNEIKSETYGSYLLIDLGEEIDNTDIDKKFSKKIYLSKNLKAVSVDKEYRYEMYLDVEPGNVLIKYMDFDGKISEKISHLIVGELTYDESEFLGPINYEFEIYEENLLSKKNLPVNIRENQIKYFNTNIKSTKTGLNRYSIRVPKRDMSFRRYLEVEYGSKIYVGVENNSKLKLPGEDFIPYIKNILRVDENNESCMIQVNLTNSLKIFSAQVTSDRETGSYEIYYMDKDGTFSKELTGLSEKVFIVSNDYGVINMMLKDQKNNIKYYQSFCTNSLYIIENL